MTEEKKAEPIQTRQSGLFRVKDKPGHNTLLFELRPYFGFLPEVIVIEAVGKKLRLHAVLTKEMIEEEKRLAEAEKKHEAARKKGEAVGTGSETTDPESSKGKADSNK